MEIEGQDVPQEGKAVEVMAGVSERFRSCLPPPAEGRRCCGREPEPFISERVYCRTAAGEARDGAVVEIFHLALRQCSVRMGSKIPSDH